MQTRDSGILNPGEALARHRMLSVFRNVVVIALASAFIGVALGQGLGGLGDLTALDFWSAVTPIAAMTLLTVEVLKRRAPAAFADLRGTFASLAIGLGWGVAMHYSPSFRMFDSLTDSLTYGAISGILASGFYDTVVHPVQRALANIGASQPRTVEVVTRTIPAQEDNKDELDGPTDSFAARVASRDRSA